jgi:iron complex transport system substrate-binding protein
MPRVVSLIASATEIVCALGFERALVGRSHECDYPAAVRRLPVCTEPRFATEGTGAEIDRRVKRTLLDALSLYVVHVDRLKEARPGVILTQSQCAVCAVSLDDVERALGEWMEPRPRVVSLEPNALADVWADIGRVADALGSPPRGRELVRRLQERMAAVAEKAAATGERPSVACLEWIDPLMAAGNWMPELVQMAGGENLFGVAGRHAPRMTWEQLREKDPDVMLALPCGWGMARARQEMRRLAEKPGWRALKAVRAGRVYVADGNQFFNRPGPRLVESLEILAEVLHPSVFPATHEGSGWQRF